MTRADQTTHLQQEVATLRAELDEARATLAALEESAERYRLLTEASLAGIYMVRDGKFVYINDRVTEILGYEPRDVIGHPMLEFVPPEYHELVREQIGRRLRGEAAASHYSVQVFHKLGHRVELEVYGSVAMVEGKAAVFGTFVDRTEERHAERALRSSEARFHAFMDNSPTIAFMKDAEGRYVYGNRLYQELLGLEPGTIAGKFTSELFPPEVVSQMAATDTAVAVRGTREQYVLTVPRDDGSHRFLVFKFPVEDPSGQRLVGGVAVDLTERLRTEADLAEKTRILESILDSMGDGVAVANEKGEFIIFNPAARRMLARGPDGTTPAEWVERYGVLRGDASMEPLPPEELPLVRALRGESVDDFELRIRHAGKPEAPWLSVNGRPLLDEEQTIRGAVVVFRDMTERRRQTEELQRAEARLRAIVEQLPGFVYTAFVDIEKGVSYVSPQIEPMLGYTPEDWYANPRLWLEITHPEDMPRIQAALGVSQQEDGRFVAEYRVRHRDGSWVWVHDAAGTVNDAAGKPELYQGIILDVTERMLERGKRERLQELSQDLVAVQEAERRRIGLELHDEVGQILTGLKLQLSQCQALPPERQKEHLEGINRLLDEATVQVRELSQNLRPSALDDLGLVPALASYFTRYRRDTGVQVEFEHEGVDLRRFPPEAETAAYRIVQEALTNAARHAKVAVVRVRAWADEDHLGVQIEDQGTGFDPDATLVHGSTRGLAGMRERAALLNGHFTVDTHPGQGCRLTAEIPI